MSTNSTSYAQAIKANLAHMGTVASDWRAVGVTRMAEETDAPDGRPMPEFDFPDGYDHAPTLYPSGTGKHLTCELCTHPIMTAYWIANDSRRWILMVGSECVKNFGEGKTGERLGKEAQWEANREYVREVERALEAFKAEMQTVRQENRWTPSGYRYVNVKVWRSMPQETLRAALKLESSLENVLADGGKHVPASDNGTITRWVNKHRQTAEQTMRLMQAELDARQARMIRA